MGDDVSPSDAVITTTSQEGWHGCIGLKREAYPIVSDLSMALNRLMCVLITDSSLTSIKGNRNNSQTKNIFPPVIVLSHRTRLGYSKLSKDIMLICHRFVVLNSFLMGLMLLNILPEH